MTRTCADCGTPIPQQQGRGRPRLYCSAVCRRGAQPPRARKPRAPARPKAPCADCGVLMHTSAASLPAGQRTCQGCRRIRREQELATNPRARQRRYERKYQARVGGGKHAHRARRYGVAYEHIVARRVFTRDRWRCGICGGQVDKTLKHPDPMAASLDHVIPMSKGGGHTYANTQCSHLKCNIDKGASIAEEGDHSGAAA